ncbi:unnamed protein product [Paramecium primaurelia]|uniref:Uncharacterized protein n=1 Tax=Paramecium primaurelia TaxID=5886 RepID=A0A8S1N5G1_PARPR|nr:unnamed protein product [Paramecium primaurelia]
MNSSVADIMDRAMLCLQKMLSPQPSTQMSEQTEHKYTSIIVFQRYISEIKAVFFYAYDPYSFIIIKQQHFDIDQLSSDLNKYYQAVEEFLISILKSNQEVCLHFKNYGPDFQQEKVDIMQPALRLIELPYLKSKIIIQINNQNFVQLKDGYLMIQYSQNQQVLLKFPQDIIKDQDIYEEFIRRQIKQVDDFHKEFIEQLELKEQYVNMYNIYSLIKDVTFIHDIPNSIYYLAKFLVNLPKLTCQETLVMISKLKIYQKNQFYLLNQKQPTKKNEGYKQLFITQLAIFEDEKNRHFPMKGSHCQKCKVCLKHNNHKIHKSSFICESCHNYYNINVALCTDKCFKLFHLNPSYYLSRKRRRKQVKIEE